MTRKRRRLYVLLACGIGLGSASALALSAFSGNLVFFISPSEIADKSPPPGRSFRLGGLVEAGSVQRATVDGRPEAVFRVTDGHASVRVDYVGVLPDLFREGQGIVALGAVAPDGSFHASEVLAKHDENYMPKEVVEALKKSGRWNPASGPPPSPGRWDGLGPSPGVLTHAGLSRDVGEVVTPVTSPAARERSPRLPGAAGEGR